ncbi:MAG: hypothetical protein HQK53_10035 [Oligoflexia bacterium]|nr:hypothetical protein [Oligoflexia bacterium]
MNLSRVLTVNLVFFTAVLVLLQSSAFSYSLPSNYDEIYPYYLKFCSTSRWSPKYDAPWGVKTGHALLYIKGARIVSIPQSELDDMYNHIGNKEVIYPKRLEAYPEKEDMSSVEKGVGLSVDYGLVNVNFFLVPSYSYYFKGAFNLDPKCSFTKDKQDEMIRNLVQEGLFDDIVLDDNAHPEGKKDLSKEEEKLFVADYAFGTDWAISMSRASYCLNLPINRKTLEKVVSYVNHLNENLQGGRGAPYRGIFVHRTKGDERYHWNAIYDNCATTAHNVFAAIGAVPPTPANEPLIRQLPYFALPANSFLRIHNEVNLQDFDVDAFYNDPILRDALLQDDWLPVSHGTFLERIDFYSPNEAYNYNREMVMRPHLVLKRYKHAGSDTLDGILEDERFSYQEEINGSYSLPHLRYYEERYQQALEDIKEKKQSVFFNRKVSDNSEYGIFVEKFERLITEKLQEVRRMLNVQKF